MMDLKEYSKAVAGYIECAINGMTIAETARLCRVASASVSIAARRHGIMFRNSTRHLHDYDVPIRFVPKSGGYDNFIGVGGPKNYRKIPARPVIAEQPSEAAQDDSEFMPDDTTALNILIAALGN